jgi:hypothetical protein
MLMWTVLSHFLLCSLTGAAIAAGAGAAWQLMDGVPAFDPLPLAALAVLGAMTTGLAGGGVSLRYQRRLRASAFGTTSAHLRTFAVARAEPRGLRAIAAHRARAARAADLRSAASGGLRYRR